MKRIEVTVPAENEEEVEEVITEFDEPAVSEIEKDDREFVKFELSINSEEIDELTEQVKALTDLETGELTINVLEETAFIEKGKRREGGSQALSVQEMYTKAFGFSEFNRTTWALIALATSIAVFGAVTQNVMVVIGAMVIAPMLGPFMSASFGLVIGDRKIIEQSVFYGSMSILFAMAVSFLIGLPIPLEPNPLIRLIANPGFTTVPLSLAVGAAAALTFATEAREALAGVAVAIALVPPSAIAGLALAMSNMDILFDVLLVIVSNVMSLILAGSLTFKLLGIKPSTYYRKKVSETSLRRALIISSVTLVVIASFVAYVSWQELDRSYARQDIERELQEQFGDRIISQEVTVDPRLSSVTLVVVSPNVTEQQLEGQLEQVVRYPVEAKLIAVASQP
ncbi:MAG: TIGR00341 family protein [Candidatus Nanohaloarchaea archaeon]|nr:TIGR00341 family protein [Candidatus Nanohaloarchaea archaeon]